MNLRNLARVDRCHGISHRLLNTIVVSREARQVRGLCITTRLVRGSLDPGVERARVLRLRQIQVRKAHDNALGRLVQRGGGSLIHSQAGGDRGDTNERTTFCKGRFHDHSFR